MNHATHTANPFYASRLKRVAPRTEERDRPVYARLPLAPRNAVPVPHLTSLYHFHRAGEYGDRSYPGNCGGNLIKDLLHILQARGLCSRPDDRQRHLPRRLRGTRHPLHVLGHPPGIRRLRPERISRQPRLSISSGLIPPYWRQKLYADDPRDLSRSPDAGAFPPALRPVHPQLCRCPETRRQAGHPDGRLLRPRGRIRPARLPHQTAGLRRRARGSTAPTSSASATVPAAARKSTAAASSPACTTSA